MERTIALLFLAAASSAAAAEPPFVARLVAPDGLVQVDALDPYLKYPVIQFPQQGSVEQPTPTVAVLVTSFDPTRPGKQIFVSDFLTSGGGLRGFDGPTGAPLDGFAPLEGPTAFAGFSLTTAVPTVAGIADNPRGLPIIPHHQIFQMQATGMLLDPAVMRRIDDAGNVVWSHFPSVQYGALPSAATFLGRIADDGSEDARFVIDEEDLSSYGRSGSTGEVVWTSANPIDQQITSPALLDVGNGTADAAFVFCRGRVSCTLEKHRASDGEMLWQRDYGSNHIFPFIAVGHVTDASRDEVVLASRQGESPFHLLLRVVDGASGDLLWEFDTGEAMGGWGPAPVVADVDGDGKDEILVQTNTQLHLVHYPDGEASGWPVPVSVARYIATRSEPVVGDLDGDGVQDIAIVSEYFDIGAYGLLDIFDANGHRKFFTGSVLMLTGAGLTPAIADVDDDGHNELILGNSINTGSPPEDMPSLWVLDFSNGAPDVVHGAILWGQFGNDAEHSARAVDMVQRAAVSPTRIALTVGADGSPVARNVAIGNHGGVAMHWSAVGVDDATSGCTAGTPADWITLDESAGIIQGGHDHVIEAHFQVNALQPGTHHADLCIVTDDPTNAELAIPVEVEVKISDRLFYDGFDG